MLTSVDHPVWSCGLRPFFLLTALSAALLIALWTAALSLGLPPPAVAGGPLVWHAHEMIFGFALTAVAGFALTAIPEFTGTPGIAPRTVRRLALLWLLGRLGFWCSGLPGVWGTTALVLSGAAQLGLLLGLALVLGPRLWADPGRRHLSFLWALLALAALVAGFHVDAWRGAWPLRWLHAALGLLMMLIVVAMSRISMRIVNRAIDEVNAANAAASRPLVAAYLARPPRRQLALLCIGLYTAAEFIAPGSRPGAWLAWAAAAALFHLQGDWHVGRALARRWPLMLHGVYVLMALGYAALGAETLLGGPGGGLHLLGVGALGLNVYVVICIAGRSHCGRALDERPWVPLGALLVVAAALLRFGASIGGAAWLAAAGIAWCAAWALLLWRIGPVLWRPRTDGRSGCDGPAPAPDEDAVVAHTECL